MSDPKDRPFHHEPLDEADFEEMKDILMAREAGGHAGNGYGNQAFQLSIHRAPAAAKAVPIHPWHERYIAPKPYATDMGAERFINPQVGEGRGLTDARKRADENEPPQN